MLRFALRSVVAQRYTHLATVMIFAAGVSLSTGCATLLTTGLHASDVLLIQFPLIIGGWALAVVIYAVVSTVGVAVEGRSDELESLRMLGSTRRQIAGMVATETVLVGLVASVSGALLGFLFGRVVLGQLVGIGRVSADIEFAPGAVSMALAVAVVVGASGVAAYVGLARRNRTTKRWVSRHAAAGVIAALGLASSSTVFALDADGVHTTAAAGPGVVLLSVGASLMAAEVLKIVRAAFAGLLRRYGSATGYLAGTTLTAAPERIRPVVAFTTLFVGVTVGTLTMQSIENGRGGEVSAQAQLMASINYSVVGAIAAFLAIALINNMIGSIRRRSAEFSSMVSLGAERSTPVRMLQLESVVACAAGALTGTIAALVAVLPFAVVKTESPLPAVSPVILTVTVAVTVLFTVGTAQVVGRRVVTRMQRPATLSRSASLT